MFKNNKVLNVHQKIKLGTFGIEKKQCIYQTIYPLTLLLMGEWVSKTQLVFKVHFYSLGVKLDCKFFLTFPKYAQNIL